MKIYQSIFPLIFALFACNFSLTANPRGMKVAKAHASSEEIETLKLIKAEDATVLFWEDFSISPSEITRFILPSKDSIVINVITENNPSKILGSLESNGKVYLINSNGIIFGEKAHIHSSNFLASAMNYLDEDYKLKKLIFTNEKDSSVINYGLIETKSGDVHLIGHKVENKGTILSSNGTACLTAANDAYFDLQNNKISIESANAKAAETGIENSGNIKAANASFIVDGALYDIAANINGKINVEGKDPTFLNIEAYNGQIDINGHLLAINEDGTGGNIQILAEKIKIKEDAIIDGSGIGNGGKILLGVTSLKDTKAFSRDIHLYPKSQIKADSIEKGTGGNITIGAESSSVLLGSISARGGCDMGDGGIIRILSGKNNVFDGKTDLEAPGGQAGYLEKVR